MIELRQSRYVLGLIQKSLQISGADRILFAGPADFLLLEDLVALTGADLQLFWSDDEYSRERQSEQLSLYLRQGRTEAACQILEDLGCRGGTVSVSPVGELAAQKTYGVGLVVTGNIADEDVSRRIEAAWSAIEPLGLLIVVTDSDAWLGRLGPDIQVYQQEGVWLLHKPDPVIEPFKNRHQGEKLYVIGNGPSLNETDLDLIGAAPSIAMNRIPLIYKRTGWRPTYYLMVSDNVLHPQWGAAWQQSVADAIRDQATHALIAYEYQDLVKGAENVTLVRAMTEFPIGTDGSFSTNAAQHLSKSGTTLNMALQLALYMGCSEVIILGADLNWKTASSDTEDINHFDPSYGAHIPHGERERIRMRNAHAYARRFFVKRSVRLLNATPGTFVDVHPLVRFPDTVSGNTVPEHLIEPAELGRHRRYIEEFWEPYKARGLLI